MNDVSCSCSCPTGHKVCNTPFHNYQTDDLYCYISINDMKVQQPCTTGYMNCLYYTIPLIWETSDALNWITKVNLAFLITNKI